jgi:hypothetical protein
VKQPIRLVVKCDPRGCQFLDNLAKTIQQADDAVSFGDGVCWHALLAQQYSLRHFPDARVVF